MYDVGEALFGPSPGGECSVPPTGSKGSAWLKGLGGEFLAHACDKTGRAWLANVKGESLLGSGI